MRRFIQCTKLVLLLYFHVRMTFKLFNLRSIFFYFLFIVCPSDLKFLIINEADMVGVESDPYPVREKIGS